MQLVSKYAGFEILTAVVMRSSIFWDITPCNALKITGILDEHFTTVFRADAKLCMLLVSCLAYSSTLKTEARFSSKMLVDFQQTTWRNIPEYRPLQSQLI
jgi:hypothetical protein